MAQHVENQFVDFYQEGMVIRMLSKEGPVLATGDIDNDQDEDIFLGSAALQGATVYLQNAGSYQAGNSEIFIRDAYYEDTAAEFFDADGDGDQDLYVGSGGNQKRAISPLLKDRLYMNDGSGNFTNESDRLPENGMNTSVVIPLDFDNDNDLDLYVGSRSIPGIYGIPPQSYIFENDGTGKFTDVTLQVAKTIEKAGMITDAQMADVNGDGIDELILVGEWMAPIVLQIQNGQFTRMTTNLENYSGWWYSVTADDVDGDGDLDLLMGNRGENFYFTGTQEEPAKLWLSDFDKNGTVEKLITKTHNGKDVPIPLKRELTEQLVSLKKQNLKHSEYADKGITDLFTSEVLRESLVLTGNWFKSSVALNDGTGNFEIVALPDEVQLSCVCTIYCKDLNGDNLNEVTLGGNFDGFTPQFSRLDGNYGQVLLNKGSGQYEVISPVETGLKIKGDIKDFKIVTLNGEEILLAAINNQKPKAYKINKVDEKIQ